MGNSLSNERKIPNEIAQIIIKLTDLENLPNLSMVSRQFYNQVGMNLPRMLIETKDMDDPLSVYLQMRPQLPPGFKRMYNSYIIRSLINYATSISILKALEIGDLEVLKLLVENIEPAYVREVFCTSIRLASSYGHLSIVHYLYEWSTVIGLDYAFISECMIRALKRAAQNNHFNIVGYLINVDPITNTDFHLYPHYLLDISEMPNQMSAYIFRQIPIQNIRLLLLKLEVNVFTEVAKIGLRSPQTDDDIFSLFPDTIDESIYFADNLAIYLDKLRERPLEFANVRERMQPMMNAIMHRIPLYGNTRRLKTVLQEFYGFPKMVRVSAAPMRLRH